MDIRNPYLNVTCEIMEDYSSLTSNVSVETVPTYDYDDMTGVVVSTTSNYFTNDSTEHMDDPSTQADVIRQNGENEDNFMFHVMYAIIGVIGFIVVVTLGCFVYRRKRRVKRNIRRVRPKSRPGALSLELLERDLLSQATSQPLYGLENSEHTETSDVSGVLHRGDSHNRPDRTLRPVVENGGSPNDQQIIDSGEREYENQTVFTEAIKSSQYETLVPHDSQDSNKTPLVPPKKTPSDKKKIPPAVAKKPKLSSSSSTRSTEQQRVENNCHNEEVEYANDTNTPKPGFERTNSNNSSVYENPDGITVEETNGAVSKSHEKVSLKISPCSAEGDQSAENNVQVYEISDTACGNVFDLNLRIPPPSPCTNKAGSYINTVTDVDETLKLPSDNTAQKSGYINIPNFKDSQKKDINPSNGLGYVNIPNERERKKGELKNQREIKSETNFEYANLKPGINKRGLSTSALPILRETAIVASGKQLKDTADDEYVHMDNCNDQANEYVAMNEDYVVMKSQDDVYIDMSSGNTASPPNRSLSVGYVNTGNKDTRGYAVPRVNTYQVARNIPRYINTGRSKSTDDVYDYADLKSISLSIDHKR